MIPHRQEYPLRKRICPLLADRRQAERALLPSRSSKPCTRTVGIRQQAARTWHREMADHARPRSPSPCSAGAGEEVSAFCTSLLWPCHFSLSAQVRCCCRREWQSYFLFPGSHRPVCSSFWSLFFTNSRSEEEGAKAHGPEDRPSAGRSFFLLPWNCLHFVLKAFSSSRQALWLVAAIHPESTTNWPETKAIEHAPPFTGHEQGGRDFDFGNVSSPGPLIWLPSCFAKQQSGHSSVIVWFCFSRKSPQKMKKITSLSKQETENKKNKRTFLESIWLCHVASHTAAQQTILPTWLDNNHDNVVSRIDVAASRHAGHTVTYCCSRHMQSLNVTSKPKRAKFKSFLPCPLPDFGAFSMTNNSVILWHFS